jgi:hypothetical protein
VFEDSADGNKSTKDELIFAAAFGATVLVTLIVMWYVNKKMYEADEEVKKELKQKRADALNEVSFLSNFLGGVFLRSCHKVTFGKQAMIEMKERMGNLNPTVDRSKSGKKLNHKDNISSPEQVDQFFKDFSGPSILISNPPSSAPPVSGFSNGGATGGGGMMRRSLSRDRRGSLPGSVNSLAESTSSTVRLLNSPSALPYQQNQNQANGHHGQYGYLDGQGSSRQTSISHSRTESVGLRERQTSGKRNGSEEGLILERSSGGGGGVEVRVNGIEVGGGWDEEEVMNDRNQDGGFHGNGDGKGGGGNRSGGQQQSFITMTSPTSPNSSPSNSSSHNNYPPTNKKASSRQPQARVPTKWNLTQEAMEMQLRDEKLGMKNGDGDGRRVFRESKMSVMTDVTMSEMGEEIGMAR